jgi:hypothetical protein
MKVEQPSEAEARSVLADAGLGGAEKLNRDQFDAL